MKRRALWLVPLAVLVTAPALAAPNSPDPANAGAAKALFDEGVRLIESKQYPDALDRLQRSQDLVPSVGALVQISECYKALEKPASAWGALNEADILATRLKDPRLPQIKGLEAKLRPEVAHVTLTVPKIEGLTVTRNGAKIDPATFDTEVPIDHGSYTIEATAPGRKPWTGKLEVAPAASATLTIPELELAPAEAVPEPPPASDSSAQRTVGIGLEIGGGAVLAAGLVFGALTLGSWSSAEKQCPDGRCQTIEDKDASQSAADRAGTFGLVSTVGVIAGAAALVGGVVLHLTAPKRQSVRATPTIGQGAYGFSFTF